MSVRRKRARKLLVASLGVASVSYVAATSGCSSETSGNLVGPIPDASSDGQKDSAPGDATSDEPNLNDVVANLVAPDGSR